MRKFLFLSTITLSILNMALADNDPNRNVESCIVPNYAKVLGIATGASGNGITATAWRRCFAGVQPAHHGNPSGELQRRNKAIQFGCLKKLAPTLTNDMVDKVMNTCRGKDNGGPNRRHGFVN